MDRQSLRSDRGNSRYNIGSTESVTLRHQKDCRFSARRHLRVWITSRCLGRRSETQGKVKRLPLIIKNNFKVYFNFRKPETIPVYNYVSSPENPILWEEFIRLGFIHGVKYTPSNAIWCPYAVTTTNIYLYWMLKLILHILPATIVDLACILTGGKPKLLNLYKKVHKFSEILGYFSTKDWQFSNKNTQALWGKLNRTDQHLFPFSMTTVSWLGFFRIYIKGLRKYLLKEAESNLEASRARNRK